MEFRIKQFGMVVASVSGAEYDSRREIHHYAEQYREDGKLTIQYKLDGRWKHYATLCQWPIIK